MYDFNLSFSRIALATGSGNMSSATNTRIWTPRMRKCIKTESRDTAAAFYGPQMLNSMQIIKETQMDCGERISSYRHIVMKM